MVVEPSLSPAGPTTWNWLPKRLHPRHFWLWSFIQNNFSRSTNVRISLQALMAMHYKILWWRWALVSPDAVAPSHMIGVSASVNLSLHHAVQKFSSGTGSPRWCRKKGHKTVLVVVYITVFKWQRKCNTACAQMRLTFPVHPSKVLTIKSFRATVNLISNKKTEKPNTNQ